MAGPIGKDHRGGTPYWGRTSAPVSPWLSWLNARSKSQIGHEFMDCSGEPQNSLLEELAYPESIRLVLKLDASFFN